MDNQNNPNRIFDSNAEIGARICKLRKKRHLTQAQLADQLGKSLRTIQKYESGEIEISVSVVNQMAIIFETTPEYILGYNSSTKTIRSLADITSFLFQLDQVDELKLKIHVEHPEIEFKWYCSIWFEGFRRDALLNAQMCLFLESWANQRQLLLGKSITRKEYEIWKAQIMAQHERIPVVCIPPVPIDNSQIHKPVHKPFPEEDTK